MKREDLNVVAALQDFIAETHLDALRPDHNIVLSEPGNYAKLLEHIRVHKYFVEKQAGHECPWDEAVAHWYDQVYLPVIDTIRKNDLLAEFPRFTESDLYLWIIEHAYYLSQNLGQEIDPRTINALVLDNLKARVRIGRYGAYLEQDNNGEPLRVSLPDNLPPGDLGEEQAIKLLHEKESGPTPLGHHPETGEPIYVLKGPYGPYVQQGANGDPDSKKKPPRASLPKGMKPEDLTLERALGLLQLPRTLGTHPETGEKVEVGIGRFGPFVRHNGEYRSLSAQDDVLAIGLERALALLAQEKKTRRTELLRELGKHPETGEVVALYTGRYGPFVKLGKVNVSIPKETAADAVTLEMALALLGQKKTQKSTKRKTSKKAAE